MSERMLKLTERKKKSMINVNTIWIFELYQEKKTLNFKLRQRIPNHFYSVRLETGLVSII